jgi:hypothetical protein
VYAKRRREGQGVVWGARCRWWGGHSSTFVVWWCGALFVGGVVVWALVAVWGWCGWCSPLLVVDARGWWWVVLVPAHLWVTVGNRSSWVSFWAFVVAPLHLWALAVVCEG